MLPPRAIGEFGKAGESPTWIGARRPFLLLDYRCG